MCVRICDTFGWLWSVRMSDVRDEGLRDGASARRRSGLSRMRRVLRGDLEERADIAVVSVVCREVRSRDVRV